MATDRTPPLDVVSIDTETLSLHAAGEIWEFGAVRRNADGTHRTLTLMLAYPNLRNADAQALAVGRFYERHPHAPVAPGERARLHARTAARPAFAREIAEFTHGAILLVNNVAFDVPRLERLLASEQLRPGWWYKPVDVVDMCRGRLAADLDPEVFAEVVDVHGPVVGWGSSLIGELLGVAQQRDDERHTALGDARWVLRLYDAALGQASPARNDAAPSIAETH